MASPPVLNNRGEVPERLAPLEKTKSTLFLKSGNQCAFDPCSEPMMVDDKLVGQVCHIEDALPGSRWNAHRTNEENRREGNLMLMCYPHHIRTKSVGEFSTEQLVAMKQKHEAAMASARPPLPGAIPGLEVSHVLFAASSGHTGIQVGLEVENLSTVLGTMPRAQVQIWSGSQGKLGISTSWPSHFEDKAKFTNFQNPKPAEFFNLAVWTKDSAREELLYPKDKLRLGFHSAIPGNDRSGWEFPRYVFLVAEYVFAELPAVLAYTIMDLHPNTPGTRGNSHRIVRSFGRDGYAEGSELFSSLAQS